MIMKKEYAKPMVKCMYIGEECLMEGSTPLNNVESSDDWQGAKECQFSDEDEADDKGRTSFWDE